MSGSLPQGVGSDYYCRLSEVIPKNVKRIIDTTGENLIESLKSKPFMVKPNIEELQAVNGEYYETYEQMIDGCRKLIEIGAENVLLSLGRKGAILTNGEFALFCKSANVAVNSTVGAGDAMIAALAVTIENGESWEIVLRSAVAAGTAAVTTAGTNLFYRDKFYEIYDKIHVEKIL